MTNLLIDKGIKPGTLVFCKTANDDSGSLVGIVASKKIDVPDVDDQVQVQVQVQVLVLSGFRSSGNNFPCYSTFELRDLTEWSPKDFEDFEEAIVSELVQRNSGANSFFIHTPERYKEYELVDLISHLLMHENSNFLEIISQEDWENSPDTPSKVLYPTWIEGIPKEKVILVYEQLKHLK